LDGDIKLNKQTGESTMSFNYYAERERRLSTKRKPLTEHVKRAALVVVYVAFLVAGYFAVIGWLLG